MGFFSSTPKFDYRQLAGSQPYVDALHNFNPWGQQQKAGQEEKIYKNASKQFTDPMQDYSKIAFIQPQLAALKQNGANAIKQAQTGYSSGSGALGEGDVNRGAAAQLALMGGNQIAGQASNIVGEGRKEAMAGWAALREARKQQALQAAGLKLGADTSAANAYNAFAKAPTSYSPSTFSTIGQVAGTVGSIAASAAGFPGVAGLASGGGSGGSFDYGGAGGGIPGTGAVMQGADTGGRHKGASGVPEPFDYGAMTSGAYGAEDFNPMAGGAMMPGRNRRYMGGAAGGVGYSDPWANMR